MSRGVLANELLELLGVGPRQPRSIGTAFTEGPSIPAAPEVPVFKPSESDEAMVKDLQGVDKDIEKSGSSEEEIIGTSFGHKVIRNGLPELDERRHDDIGKLDYFTMGSKYPGGDVMGQLPWQKWKHFSLTGTGVSVPPEEDWYAGARLGEYAKPLIMDEEKVGYLNQAPVPMSQSEDLLTLVSESGVGSRRARHAALYAKASAGQAEELFRLAQRRMRQVLRDPPLSVFPGGDVYPFYSASMPVLLVVPSPPRLPSRDGHSARHVSRPERSQQVEFL